MFNTSARILAVTDSPSLAIGLTLLPNDWDVTSRSSIGDVMQCDVLVLDLKTTKAGLKALGLDGGTSRRVAAPVPAIVIGDEFADGELPSNLVVLPRPYTFSDLAQRIGHLLIHGMDGEPWVEEVAFAGSIDELGGAAVNSTGADPSGNEATAPLDDIIDVRERSSTRLAQQGDEDKLPHLTLPASGGSNLPPPPVPADMAPDGAVHEGRRVIRIPEIEGSPADRRALVKRRRRANTSEDAARQTLARALAATAELDLLVEEVPQRASIPAMARVIVDVAAELLEADTVGLWRRGDLGWTVLAQHGLTPHQAKWVVADDQPLFSEVHRTGGSLLIDPVEQVPAAVAGIGGAFTESFMAISLAAGAHRYGIIAAGRDRPLTSEDLDVLGGLALEAAIGFAIGEHAARLQAAVVAPEEVEPAHQRSWHRVGSQS